jgi:geranylgeranyl pyrophosphate synthase
MVTAAGNDRISREEAQVHVVLDDGCAFSLSVVAMMIGGARLSWASLSDVARRRCATAVVGDARLPAVLREQASARHPLVRRALDEVLAAGRLAYPDAIGEPLARGALNVAFANERIRCKLVLAGRDVSGTIELDGVAHEARGRGTRFEGACAAVVLLDDGTEIRVSNGRATVGGRNIAATLEPLATWTSHYTFHDFATAWRLRIPDAQLDLELRASFDEQELVTLTAAAPLWRGRCDVSGSTRGVAFVDQPARDAAATLPELFGAVPRETRRVIQRELPLPLTSDGVVAILGGELGRYVLDFDPRDFERTLVRPIREVMDRIGKAWRSYAAVMCYHALGGDAVRRDTIDALLSLTEIIHGGSLIVDDVEDNSPTRRGGPSVHVAHGVPIAINAGTFCYFAWQSWFARLGLSDAARLQIYENYFEFMRLAHLGQALDLQGFTRSTDELVATGDIAALTRQMHNVYVFKTGAPASAFARFGAIVAGGGADAVRAIGELFEALGIAFQIMDDVQNLRGFVGDPKHAEDLAQAKLTMPVLEAMRALDESARRELWERIVRCGREPALVPEIIDTLERCGAFVACRDAASELIESAWRRAAPLLDDSIAKVMLRSFCFYVVECLE